MIPMLQPVEALAPRQFVPDPMVGSGGPPAAAGSPDVKATVSFG